MSRRPLALVAALSLAVQLVATPLIAERPPEPWAGAGITDREAAAHLLNRLAFGPRPGDVDRVVSIGPWAWIEIQLAPIDDRDLTARLARLRTNDLSAAEIARTYPNPGMVFAEARAAGVIPQDLDPQTLSDADQRTARRALIRFALERGYRRQRELHAEMLDQKLIRAAHSVAQLQEVLTDFWFNHFTVSISDPETRPWVLAFERDAIRPHVLGSFREMLGAVARHPAMLLYLDAFRSGAAMDADTTMIVTARAQVAGMRSGWSRRSASRRLQPALEGRRGGTNAPTGVNENYARELLELHTLGVNGGYTQEDVAEVARAFTGWTVLPPGRYTEQVERHLRRVESVGGLGFVHEGAFLFRADLHDAGAKTVLGHTIPAGGGIEDGERVLDLLAGDPSTARHLATRLCQRFVGDDPPDELVGRVADTFSATAGDLRATVLAILASPEFWAEATDPGKIKSPLELAVSAVRAVNGDVLIGRELARRVEAMGQPLYAASSPAGYPETGEAWLAADALLERMRLAADLVEHRVAGVISRPPSDPLELATWSRAVMAGDGSRAVAANAPSSSGVEPAALVLGSPAFQRR